MNHTVFAAQQRLSLVQPMVGLSELTTHEVYIGDIFTGRI